jgi:hypothetical protein
MPGIAPVKVDLQIFAQTLVQLVALNENADFRVEVQRSRNHVRTADESVLLVYNNQFGITLKFMPHLIR